MAAQVTQCPNCGTSFRITDSQLELAKGAVRCGACLSVFKAAEYFIQEPASTPDPIDQETESPTEDPNLSFEDALAGSFGDMFDEAEVDFSTDDTPVVTDTQTGTGDQLISDDMLISEPDPIALIDDSSAEHDDDNMLISDDGLIHADSLDQPDELINDNPEVDAIRLEPTMSDDFDFDVEDDTLIDDDLEMAAPEVVPLYDEDDLELSDDFLSMDGHDNVEEQDVFMVADRDGDDGLASDNDAADESWAADMLLELESEPETPPQKPKMVRAEFGADEQQLHLEVEDHFVLGGDDSDHSAMEVQVPADVLAGLKVAPVHFHPENSGNKGATIGWALLSLLLLAAIPLQYAYFGFQELSRQQQYRPWYQKACVYLECQLPEIADTQKIKTEHLVPPRSHPKYQNALVVDFIMNNRASFEQPFPLIELSFSDINDKVIASRQFTPQEYLGGELTGTKTMPIQTPISLSLEIVDPGKAASGYNLRYLPIQ